MGSKYGKFVFRRVINGIIAFILIIIAYSALLNTQLDVTARGMIIELAKGIVMSTDFSDMTNEEIEQYRKDVIKRLEKYYDLDKPIYVRIVFRAFKAMTFNLGRAKTMRTPHYTRYAKRNSPYVKDLILEALPPTLILFVTTSILGVIISIILGIKKAQFANSSFDKITSILMMCFSGTPSWWIGSILILIFVLKLDILPFGAMNSSPPPTGTTAFLLDRAKHMILPVMAVLVVRFWDSAYLIRNIIMVPMEKDFITAARGRGLPEKKIIYGHALRTASPAIVDMAVLTIVLSFSGDIILEQVLAWPGIGMLLWQAIRSNDIPVMMGILTTVTMLYVTALILIDITYGFLDPRIGH